MKLGLGLYRHQLNAEHYRFARQCGCTHLVIHLVDYFRSSRSNQPGDQPVGDDAGWGLAGDPNKLWTFEELAAIKKEINATASNWRPLKILIRRTGTTFCSTARKNCSRSKISKPSSATSARGHSGFRLQLFHRRRRGPREGKIRARRCRGRRHGRPARQTAAQRHGLEHGL
jgi:hypothetical protein